MPSLSSHICIGKSPGPEEASENIGEGGAAGKTRGGEIRGKQVMDFLSE